MRKTLSFIFVIALLALTVFNVRPAMANFGDEPPYNPFDFGFNWKWNEGVRFTWTIEKIADETDLLLSPGQLIPVTYQVTVGDTSAAAGYVVRGDIFVHNVDPTLPLTINWITVTGMFGSPAVTCPKMTVDPGETITCNFYANAADKTPGTVIVEANLSNAIKTETKHREQYVNYDSNANNHKDPTIPVGSTDECVDVTDTNVGFLGTVCADQAPMTFSYTLFFGNHPDADIYLECGETTHENIASFVTNDTSATGSDDAVVTAEVACGGGCSLTQGYWKTHSSFGPAPYDSTWAMVGESTTFFLSGQSWISVFNTAPAGNPYYILAHQYMAAVLNELNGASIPAEVATAMTQANAFFTAYGPETAWTKAQKQMITSMASVLDSYNNGLIGPGHCTE